MTWFLSPRLETRIKESSTYASSKVVQTPHCTINMHVGMCAATTDFSSLENMSVSVHARTRKMVNYAC